MAIQADIKTHFGVSATYWRILYQVSDFRTDTVTVVIGGYANAEARRANAEPMSIVQDIRLSGVKASADPGRGALYDALIAYAGTLPPDHPQAVIIPLGSKSVAGLGIEA